MKQDAVMESREISIGPATLDQIVDLRHVVLRAGLPRHTAIFEGDELATTRHYGAFVGGSCVGCATCLLNQWGQSPAWQLRGMATDAQIRGRGVGAALLRHIEADLRRTGVLQMWCNARVPAAGFYQKQGWKIASDIFEIPTAGPHYKMTRRLNGASE